MADKVVRVERGVKVRIERGGQYYWDFETSKKAKKGNKRKGR